MNLEGVGLDLGVEIRGQCGANRCTSHNVDGLLGSLAQTEVVTQAEVKVLEELDACAHVPRGGHVLLLEGANDEGRVVIVLLVAEGKIKLRARGDIDVGQFAQTVVVLQVDGDGEGA